MRVGEWNVAIGVVGGPGCGKSFYAQHRARQLLAQQPTYCIAHDPTMSIRGADVHRYRSEAELLAGLKAAPAGIHVLDVADGLRVVKLAVAVGEAAKRQPDPTPTLLVLDEIVAVGNMSPSYLDPAVQEAYAMRRHVHLGWIFCSQRPQQAHPSVWELSTELVIFRVPTRRQLDRLEDLGVPAATLDAIPNLPKHRHVVHRVSG